MGVVSDETVQYTLDHTSPLTPDLQAVLEATQRDTPSPGMMSGTIEARVLEMLIVTSHAHTALEVGTFTGFGALTMAAAMSPTGKVTTIEYNGELAGLARKHIEASPYRDRIELIVGDAREIVGGLDGPFDVIYLDAWKHDYIHYYETLLPKLAPRGVIVADNVLWGGRVVNPGLDEEEAQAVAAFNAHVRADVRTTSTVLSVGDGLLLAWRAPAERQA